MYVYIMQRLNDLESVVHYIVFQTNVTERVQMKKYL